jgi:hypothetical protein
VSIKEAGDADLSALRARSPQHNPLPLIPTAPSPPANPSLPPLCAKGAERTAPWWLSPPGPSPLTPLGRFQLPLPYTEEEGKQSPALRAPASPTQGPHSGNCPLQPRWHLGRLLTPWLPPPGSSNAFLRRLPSPLRPVSPRGNIPKKGRKEISA